MCGREGGVGPTGKRRKAIKRQKTMFGTREHGPTWKGSYGNEAKTSLSVVFCIANSDVPY